MMSPCLIFMTCIVIILRKVNWSSDGFVDKALDSIWAQLQVSSSLDSDRNVKLKKACSLNNLLIEEHHGSFWTQQVIHAK